MSAPLYAGDGCNVHPHCLTCPLAFCKYDVPVVQQRNAEIRRLRQRGESPAALARRFGLSKRSVWRALERRAA